MQYLVRTLTDSTGHPFTHVTKARENETLTVVDAESKAEAERIIKIKEEFELRKVTRWDTDSMHI